jgi:hypothetical protein
MESFIAFFLGFVLFHLLKKVVDEVCLQTDESPPEPRGKRSFRRVGI